MLTAQSSQVAKQMVEMSISESRSRLEFLEGELRKLKLSDAPAESPAFTLLPPPEITQDSVTRFGICVLMTDFIRYGTVITSELVKFRLDEILTKLAIEQRVRTGTENLLAATSSAANVDVRRKGDIEGKLQDSKAKQSVLLRAKNRYAQLYVPTTSDKENDEVDGA
jgi:hypothetical protein